MDRIYKLMYISTGGLFACTCMNLIFLTAVSKKIMRSPIHEEAITILRQHEGAMFHLGEPIKELRACFYDYKLYCAGKLGIKVDVVGPKSKGILFLTAAPDQDMKLHLESVELQIGKDDSRRLILKKLSNEKELRDK